MIKRKLRVDLSSFDPEWQDCYILLSSSGIEDQLNLQKKIRHIERDQKKIEKQIEIEEVEQLKEDLEDRLDDLTKDLGMIIYDEIKRHFISGIIFDFDEKKSREMTLSDINSLDLEVIKSVYSRLAGVLEKKA